MTPSHRIQQAITNLQNGRPIILCDDSSRENEGDLILSAEKCTPEWINFMIRYGSGIICLCLEDAHVERLGLPMMVTHNRNCFKTAFTISIEASSGITTGVSAKDRTHTIRTASNPQAERTDVVSPGHIFPLRARPGGLKERRGHTEGSLELMKIAGLYPAAALCELMNEDGSIATLKDAAKFAISHDLVCLSMDDLLSYKTAEAL